nr:PREDICTED: stomatin-like protein 2, mitochondrial isoform X2 [Apteryx mantelli mantelli]
MLAPTLESPRSRSCPRGHNPRPLTCSQQLKHAAWLAPAPQRWNSGLPVNIGVLFVPQQEAWVVERMGKFHRILEPGLNFLIPLLDRIRYVQSLKEIVINVPEQSAVTLDNVTLQIDGVLYLRVMDPYKASYGVEDPEYAVTQLAQTTMRSELGKLSLDRVFRERESLNASIVDAINQASDYWGIRCLRYEIKDIHVPPRVKESMQMQEKPTPCWSRPGPRLRLFSSWRLLWRSSMATQPPLSPWLSST